MTVHGKNTTPHLDARVCVCVWIVFVCVCVCVVVVCARVCMSLTLCVYVYVCVCLCVLPTAWLVSACKASAAHEFLERNPHNGVAPPSPSAIMADHSQQRVCDTRGKHQRDLHNTNTHIFKKCIHHLFLKNTSYI